MTLAKKSSRNRFHGENFCGNTICQVCDLLNYQKTFESFSFSLD